MTVLKDKRLLENSDGLFEKIGLGTCLGACFGAVFGKMVLFLALGLTIGITAGLVYGLIYYEKNKLINH